MRAQKLLLAVACSLALCSATAFAEKQDFKPNVVQGPMTAHLGGVAQIEVPAGYEFIDGPTLRQMLKALGEPASDDMLGAVSPTNDDWSVVFSYDAIGYVKDDDKDKLNADKLLQEYKDGTAEGNKERVRNGNAPLVILGWQKVPSYNEATHNLEWSIRASSRNEEILNYDTRLLGRKGVMEVSLIVEPKDLDRVLPVFTNLLAGYSYLPGQNYSEYRKGDKVAKYGLAALITAGAAVGAAKLGLFAWLAVLLKKGFKLVVVAVVAVIAFFKKLLAKIFGRSNDQTSST